MTRREHLDSLAISLLLACCLFWGFQQVLVKATLSEVPPLLQAAVRFAGATVLLWLWCQRRGVALFSTIARRTPFRNSSVYPGKSW